MEARRGRDSNGEFEKCSQSFEKFVRSACASAILLQGLFACVEKILLVAFGSKEATRPDSEVIQSNGFNAFANGQDGLIVQLFVFHDSAGANLLAAQFELRLDENEKA